jgi:hypothetical protein
MTSLQDFNMLIELTTQINKSNFEAIYEHLKALLCRGGNRAGQIGFGFGSDGSGQFICCVFSDR